MPGITAKVENHTTWVIRVSSCWVRSLANVDIRQPKLRWLIRPELSSGMVGQKITHLKLDVVSTLGITYHQKGR